MSADNDQEVRDRLGAALGSITPGPVPFDAAVRQGRGIRARRGISVAAGLAVAAAVVVAGPAWLHQQHSTAVAPSPPVVTVVRPGQGSPTGLIASGKVGTRTWSARVTSDRKGQVCVLAGSSFCGPSGPASSVADIVGGAPDNGTPVMYGAVKRAVTRVTVRLGDGQLLVLHPQKIDGTSWIAFPVPARVGVSRATAYAGRSELAYAIPFNGAADLPPAGVIFGIWLKPGDTPHRRGTSQVGSGVLDGKPWVEKEYSGPWGNCFATVGLGEQDCIDGFGSNLDRGQLEHLITASPGNNGGGLYLAEVASSVARVTVTASDGTVLRPAVTVGDSGLKYIVYNLGQGHPLRWTAYDAAGHQLGSGNAGIPG
jgi:hypothetical protein